MTHRICIPFLVLLAACGDGDDAAFRAQALARAEEFQAALRSELLSAIAAGGPAAAVAVCKERAPALAATMSRDGMRVRRIGTRIRNPDNRPDPRDEAALAQLQQKADEAVLDEGAPRRLYVPLLVQPPCLLCHGDTKAMPSDLQQRLAQLYPADEATGYAQGDLRGAVVVERAD
jgi:hypothetical protein